MGALGVTGAGELWPAGLERGGQAGHAWVLPWCGGSEEEGACENCEEKGQHAWYVGLGGQCAGSGLVRR